MIVVAPLYALPLVALFIGLSVAVVSRRRDRRVSLGDGGDAVLLARIRAHGNCAEFAPLGLVVLLLAELAGAAPFWLHLTGTALVAGRLAHAAALLGGPMMLRVGGMALTFAALGIGALAAVLG